MALTRYVYLDPLIDDETTVLAIRAKALSLLQAGVQTMSWQGEGTSASKQFTAPVMDILNETRAFLKQKNPNRYGYLTSRSKVIFS
jgi:hypothetical protein